MESRGLVTSSTGFMPIYQAAKDDDRRELNRLFKLYGTVDIKDEIHVFTPAARLASEGFHDAVELLRMLGASDDYIAMGYASKNFRKEAEELRVRRGVKLKHLVIGAAMNADKAYAEDLRKMYRLRPEWLVLGASYAKNFYYVNQLMSLECDDMVRQDTLFAHVNGCVLAGELGFAEAVAARYKDDKNISTLMKLLMTADTDESETTRSLTSYSRLLKAFSTIEDEDLYIESTKQPLKFGSRLNKVDAMSDPALIIADLAVSCHFYNRELLEYALAFAELALLDKLSSVVSSVDDNLSVQMKDFRIEDAIRVAKDIKLAMSKYDFNYDEARYFVNSESLRKLMSEIAQLEPLKRDESMREYWWKHSDLPSDILQKILAKYRLAVAKEYVCQKGQEYVDTTWTVTSNHKERVASLHYAVSHAESLPQLRNIAFKQFGMFIGVRKGSHETDAPKHEQDLTNKTQATLYKKLEEVFESKLLNY
jgi:hypothetical protein